MVQRKRMIEEKKILLCLNSIVYSLSQKFSSCVHTLQQLLAGKLNHIKIIVVLRPLFMQQYLDVVPKYGLRTRKKINDFRCSKTRVTSFKSLIYNIISWVLNHYKEDKIIKHNKIKNNNI